MRKVLRRKLKVYAVDAAMIFAAVQMTFCINGQAGADRVEAEPQNIQVYEREAAQDTEADPVTAGAVEVTEEADAVNAVSKDWDADESMMLKKIAMAEAENQDTEGKALVMLVVLNRVQSDSFPDTIGAVIFQENQFSPVSNGSYAAAVPDEDCEAALDLVMSGWNESQGALYFESESESTWHQDNLKYLFTHGDHYFYTEYEEE